MLCHTLESKVRPKSAIIVVISDILINVFAKVNGHFHGFGAMSQLTIGQGHHDRS